MGGNVPDHFISIGDDYDPEKVKDKLKQCLDRAHGDPAVEVKVVVILFQDVPLNICPYYALSANPQKINESNTWGTDVIEACVAAIKEVWNVVVLNGSTDGVACEVAGNLKQTEDYLLQGKTNQISLPDPNHHVKNLRYQLIGCPSPASIGFFIFDRYMLSAAKVWTEFIRIDGFTLNALPMKLALILTIRKLI